MAERTLPEFDRPVNRVSYLDGCKVYMDNAWVILRFSGTEPRVRIFAEAETVQGARKLVEKMAAFAGLAMEE